MTHWPRAEQDHVQGDRLSSRDQLKLVGGPASWDQALPPKQFSAPSATVPKAIKV